MAYHNELGKLGEQLAVDYLARNGFAILERNFIYDKAELDIIAQKDKKVIIIGPSPSLEGSGKGKWIDDFDVVAFGDELGVYKLYYELNRSFTKFFNSVITIDVGYSKNVKSHYLMFRNYGELSLL